jgi:hypothetical protein
MPWIPHQEFSGRFVYKHCPAEGNVSCSQNLLGHYYSFFSFTGVDYLPADWTQESSGGLSGEIRFKVKVVYIIL